MASRNRKRIETSEGPRAPVVAMVQNERAIDGASTYRVRFDLAADIRLNFPGPTGPRDADPLTSDLLDIALSIFFVERDLRRLALTNRVKCISVQIPVRRPDIWTLRSSKVADILRFMGGHDWGVSFVQSTLPVRNATERLKDARSCVVLHSGGMDSTCGLGTLLNRRGQVQLVSFYTSQRHIQEQIAEELGFGQPSQLYAAWRHKNSRRGRSGFAYRSFLFLAIATLVARSFRARSIVQFENGFMAASVPPCPNYFVTRHAHPKYHRLFNELLVSLSIPIEVSNPLRWKTKHQAVLECRRAIGAERAEKLLALTQSCWFYSYHQFPSRFKRERIEKTPHQHCGLCVPCLIRRAAFRDEAYSLDPRKPPSHVRDKANVSYNFDAYAAFCRLVLSNQKSPEILRRALLEHGIVLDQEAGPWSSLHPLIVQFARDFGEAFGNAYVRG